MQIKVTLNGIGEPTKIIQAIKTHAPKMSNHGGRTWDYVGKLTDQPEVEIYADTTWGFYGYFAIAGQWYKFRLVDRI